MKSYDVRFWKIQTRKGRRKPYEVRWVVADRPFSQSFVTGALADSFRAQLITAARNGEAFDSETGLPDSMHREKQAVTWFEHAVDYVAAKWPKAAGNSRRSIIEGVLAVTPVLVRDLRGAPDTDTLREAIRWAVIPSRDQEQQPEEVIQALVWLRKASLPITALTEHNVASRVLAACATRLDGAPAAPEYHRRRRRILYNCLQYAVNQGRLRENPLALQTLRKEWTQPDVDSAVDPRAVANPRQVADALVVCSYVGRRQGPRFVAFYGCMYYAMMRPAEVTRLRRADCHLPESGWGKLILEASAPEVGKDYTDNGELHDDRSLKGRSKKTVRPIPIPPELVTLLRQHIERFGVAADGRLFRSESGRPIPKSAYTKLWKKVRALVLPPEQLTSPLMARPYDLRHAGVTWRLSAGIPAAQVAEWAGHSVEVLQRIYHRCMSGYDEVWIDRMDRARKGK
ncbi:site-specific integrase [Planomonospora sp. ID67723]|uniref:tyrosine-type recombinase/integrase n=1 Tax=Planomonospora sp. ID67723 TaxID=2738134 RepID=UPI0018C3EAD9|nr:site-specific integrase [Planomonospora sp. ID67723]MBG0828198.1 site-specific integrase [Planomonospora sp. ID67723]